ncbi:MFS transporter [Hippea jasoniae]|uniref:MFS transporter n=1 Tax=Hippea jasoniae TaxID=944479 RepID=UPI0005547B76|nr:MFS transporter [Hippea jasoniae]
MNRKRKNYILGVLHGVFYFASNAFVDYTTVLPSFLKYLLNSDMVIGFVAAIARGGSVFFQLISAFYLEGKRKKPYLVAALWVRFLSWVAIAVGSYLFLPDHPLLELILFIVCISIFSFAAGVAVIPFYDIISYNIPADLLGRFWAVRQFVGGILAVGSGWIVKIVLAKYGYPEGYELLFVFAMVGFGLTSLSLGLMDEGRVQQKKNKSFKEFLSKAYEIFKNHKDFRVLITSEFLSHSIFLCMPFIVLYTTKKLHFESLMIGYFVSAQMVGSIVSNLFWGYFADRKGAKFIIISVNLLAVSVPVLSALFKTPLSFILVFFLMGAYIHGVFIGYTNYLLKIAPQQKRPTYVSIRGSFNALSYFLPTAGGLIADKLSYDALFVISSAFALLSLLFSLRLK